MNNETLKRDLCARYVDKVKVIIYSELFGEYDDVIQKEYIDYEGSFKPYLFSISALTKEIQLANYNNGEPFVPVEMMKEVLMMEWCSVYDDAFDELLLPDCRFNALPFDFIELLNRWHINYRLSPDQFIEVTEEFNPYK